MVSLLTEQSREAQRDKVTHLMSDTNERELSSFGHSPPLLGSRLDKGPSSQSCGFPSSHVRMWQLDHKEGRAPKNECFWTVVLEKTLESPLDCKEIKSVYPKGNQPWIFIGRTDAEAPILWPPDVKSWLTGKDPDAGKDRRQEEKGVTQNEMVGWHHQLRGHESEQAPGDSEEWKPGMLQSMGSQRVRHNLEIEQQQQTKKELKLF